MVVRPYGWALWENIQAQLDRQFKATGVTNAAFPLLIPMSFLEREKEHVEGFAPQLAVVTIGGGEKLEEPLVIRPTSETIIGHMWSKWIKSYRDLPVLLNQWNSVVRWEMRTKLFLRTMEFYWQEGHTAHAGPEEAEGGRARCSTPMPTSPRTKPLCPSYAGQKSESEKFAGALRSYSIEAMMGDTRALQAGTSHNLGDNFAKAFEIRYLDRENKLQFCWTTSWGFSTRFIGAIIMVHGDDQGLILPPRLAPYQVVVVPIYKSDAERVEVLQAVDRLTAELPGLRVHVDRRDGLTPGFKFNDWEMRGVPLRIELGPKDIARQQVMLSRRDLPGREGKRPAPVAGLAALVQQTLDEIHTSLYRRAETFRRDHTHSPTDYDEFKVVVQDGWADVWWCEQDACEALITEDTHATIPLHPHRSAGRQGHLHPLRESGHQAGDLCPGVLSRPQTGRGGHGEAD